MGSLEFCIVAVYILFVCIAGYDHMNAAGWPWYKMIGYANFGLTYAAVVVITDEISYIDLQQSILTFAIIIIIIIT